MITWRQMNFDDAEEARRVAFLYECVPNEWTPGRQADPAVVERLAQGLLDRTKEHWVELDIRGEEIVASHILQYFAEREGFAVIRTLWVHPDLRGQGLGKRLKLAGEAWARAKGAKALVTQVHVANQRMTAINEAMGFEPVKIEYEKKL